jgi:hypothetical protein
VKIPSQIRAGDTVKWRDLPSQDVFGNPVSSSAGWTLTYYLRFNKNNEGTTAVGTAYQDGWELVIPQATTAGFDPGDWFWQAEATKSGEHITLGAGMLQVVPGLSYSGNPSAFDGRSQAHKDLDAVDAAIRAIVSGGAVQEYRIGIRSLKKYDLAELHILRSRLIAEVKREQAADSIANGLGNPHSVFVRFGPGAMNYPFRTGNR